MKTKYFKFLSVFVAVIIAFSCFSFVVSADTNFSYVFDFPIAQPQISNDIGYLEVLYQRPGFSSPSAEVLIIHSPEIYFNDGSDYDESHIHVSVRSDGLLNISINPRYSTGDSTFISCFYYSSFNNSSSLYSSNGLLEIDYDNILGVHCYGDIVLSRPSFTLNNNFVFNYGSDALALERLNGIYETLKSYTAGDPCFDIPDVGGSSLDYGFLNYSVPVLENLNGSVIGGSSVYGPYLEPKENYKAPFPYYSYSCASSLKLNSGKFSPSTSYVVSLSLNFNVPVYRASFKIYLRDATFVNQVFTSYGSDELSPWVRSSSNGYVYISIYNISHPVKLYFTVKTNSSLEYGGSSLPFCMSLSDMTYAPSESDIITSNANANTDKTIANQNANTDKVLDAGSDTNQPDFAGTNGSLDSTTNQMNALENQYKIDPTSTNQTLSSGSAFLSSSDMNKASIQVKTWIEKFSSENSVFTSFIVASLCLGLCFWVIGRKAGS